MAKGSIGGVVATGRLYCGWFEANLPTQGRVWSRCGLTVWVVESLRSPRAALVCDYRLVMARKDITMTEPEMLEFLTSGHTLQVATIGGDGFPHVAPMWYTVEDGKVAFRSFTKSQKMVNLRRNPKLTVLVEAGDGYSELQGVMIKGTATLIEDRAFVLAMYGKLAAKYEMVGGARVELSPDELEEAFGRFAEKNTAVVVEPRRTVSWDHTKLGDAY